MTYETPIFREDDAAQILRADLGRRITAGCPRKSRIAREASEKHRISLAMLRGESRNAEIVSARWEAMLAMHKDGHSKNSIAKFFNRDHSSVVYAIKKMEAAQ